MEVSDVQLFQSAIKSAMSEWYQENKETIFKDFSEYLEKTKEGEKEKPREKEEKGDSQPEMRSTRSSLTVFSSFLSFS